MKRASSALAATPCHTMGELLPVFVSIVLYCRRVHAAILLIITTDVEGPGLPKQTHPSYLVVGPHTELCAAGPLG